MNFTGRGFRDLSPCVTRSTFCLDSIRVLEDALMDFRCVLITSLIEYFWQNDSMSLDGYRELKLDAGAATKSVPDILHPPASPCPTKKK